MTVEMEYISKENWEMKGKQKWVRNENQNGHQKYRQKEGGEKYIFSGFN